MHCAKHLDALLYALRLPASSKKRTYTHSDPNANSYSYGNSNRNAYGNNYAYTNRYCYSDGYAHTNGDTYSYRNIYTYTYATKPVRGSQLHRH